MLRREQNDLLTQTGPGTPDGQAVPQLLDCRPCSPRSCPRNDCPPVRVKVLSERLIAFRDSEGRLRADRRVLRPSRRVAVVRPQRGSAACAAPITAGNTTSPANASRCPRSRRKAASAKPSSCKSYPLVERGGVLWTYMGAAGDAAAAAGMGIRTGAGRAALRLQAAAGMQLAAGDGRRHRFQPRLVPAPRRPQFRSAVHAAPRATSTIIDGCPPGVRGRGERRRALYRRPPQCRGRPLLLAHHPMGDAVLHHDRAARRSSGARPLLDSDRRRELLGLELRLPSDPRRSPTPRSPAMQDGKGIHVRYVPGTLSGRSPTRTTTT